MLTSLALQDVHDMQTGDIIFHQSQVSDRQSAAENFSLSKIAAGLHSADPQITSEATTGNELRWVSCNL
jgi:hypothetical protein